VTKWKSPEELAKWLKRRDKARAKSQLPSKRKKHGRRGGKR
jgi:hypothetical protein